MSIRIKTKFLCKHNFTGRCQTFGCWHWSLHTAEAQCSLFIFVGWQSAWLSNKGKSLCPCEIIIKQRTTHSAQCVECVNTGGEQVCCTYLIFWVMSTAQGKQGCSHSRVMTYRTEIDWIAFQVIPQSCSWNQPPSYLHIVFHISLPISACLCVDMGPISKPLAFFPRSLMTV